MSGTAIPGSHADLTAPTPQNTPLQAAPITSGLSRPTVPDIGEADEDAEDDGPGGGIAGALNSAVQARLAGLLGQSSGYIENLPLKTRTNVAALKGVQAGATALAAQYRREVWALEQKYADLGRPLQERRREIVAGAAPPTQAEIDAGEKVAREDDDEYEGLPAAAEGDEADVPAGVPDFWLTALQNHPTLIELVTDKDAAVLKHLTDITLHYLPADEGTGFRLRFHFAPNEWFENTTLEKTYVYSAELDYAGEFMYDKAIGSEIKWKSDEKDLTKVVEVKKQRNKNTNRTRLVKKTRPADSFFNFFSPPKQPTEEEQEDMDPDELGELEAKLGMDYELGEEFKDKIIPKAVDWFTGKALDYEMDDNDDDLELDEDDDEDDFDDEDDESDDEPPVARRRGGKGRGGAAAAAAGENVDPNECKQQ